MYGAIPLLGCDLPQKAPPFFSAPTSSPLTSRICNAALRTTFYHLFLGFPTGLVLWNFPASFFLDPFIFHSCNSAVWHPPRVSEGRIEGIYNPSVHNWPGWLRHCATGRKVAGSIHDFHWKISLTQSFRPHLFLRSTQPLTEMNTRNISWGERRPVRRADNLIIFTRLLS
jgi:hypothetical protein